MFSAMKRASSRKTCSRGEFEVPSQARFLSPRLGIPDPVPAVRTVWLVAAVAKPDGSRASGTDRSGCKGNKASGSRHRVAFRCTTVRRSFVALRHGAEKAGRRCPSGPAGIRSCAEQKYRNSAGRRAGKQGFGRCRGSILAFADGVAGEWTGRDGETRRSPWDFADATGGQCCAGWRWQSPCSSGPPCRQRRPPRPVSSSRPMRKCRTQLRFDVRVCRRAIARERCGCACR